MGTEVFLGMPPANVERWIRDRRGPKLDEPLFFEANEPGASVTMLCWDDYNGQQTSLKCHLQYSTDKMATWATYNGSIVDLDDCTDSRVYFRADPENPNTDGFHRQDWEHEEVWWHYFKTDGSVKAGGNIQFLLEFTGTRTDVPAYGFYQLFGTEEYNEETGETTGSCSSLTTAPSLPATALADSCYASMFQDCQSLETAPSLPATTLAGSCYASMFWNCQSLETAPDLPAENLAASCYASMFFNCKSLTKPPVISAKTLNMSCYASMFSGCSSLATAPELPIEELKMYCYNAMFQGCTSLTAAPTLPAKTLVNNCYNNMFSGCAALTSFPEFPAKTLNTSCYYSMFSGCSNLAGTATIAFDQMSTIPTGAFTDMFRNCSQMNVVLDFGSFTSVPAVNGNTDTVKVFETFDSRLTVKVPASLIDRWKNYSYWANIASHIVEA